MTKEKEKELEFGMEKMIDSMITLLEKVRNTWQSITVQERRSRGRRVSWDRLKWRLAGAGLIVLTMPVVKVLEGDATIALLTVPLGTYMILGKTIGEQ
ncbi:MAG TPA: hypothetical protein DCZ40_08675 [Lachnospiraceae bacterium]|nr:hypothetical protein [Lachnospiraceae bacterium]